MRSLRAPHDREHSQWRAPSHAEIVHHAVRHPRTDPHERKRRPRGYVALRLRFSAPTLVPTLFPSRETKTPTKRASRTFGPAHFQMNHTFPCRLLARGGFNFPARLSFPKQTTSVVSGNRQLGQKLILRI